MKKIFIYPVIGASFLSPAYADDAGMKAYHFSDGSTQIVGNDGGNFLCITRNSMSGDADNTVTIMSNGEDADFIISSSQIKGRESNQTFTVLFSYEQKFYHGIMIKSPVDHDSFKLNLDKDAALSFLRAFKNDGKLSISAIPFADPSPGLSKVTFEWPTFNRDMLHQQACEESKGHITGAIEDIQ
ncbi:hypothetical protein [Komagataeibacter rhaeticus]|uniref:hypothetical protein n=1 Tax=Komagataeibacter rhaeticus TaxID=215221 RepID=UPI0011B85628|nr:hypothetical protein [Komagataeibacter rhaeticus]GBQ13310.1 hypothetical protein AA16663_1438 [Komagataeibacter rhaeticus DSM 16663]